MKNKISAALLLICINSSAIARGGGGHHGHHHGDIGWGGVALGLGFGLVGGAMLNRSSYYYNGYGYDRFQAFYPYDIFGYNPYGNPYVYNQAPQIVIQQAPIYIQQPQQNYWYYCNSAGAYYPYVQECAEEWQKVEPREPR